MRCPARGRAIGINDRGLVTGVYTDPATGDLLSFVMERGVLTTGISFPGATITALGPANNRGVEIGNYGDDTDQRAVLHDVRSGAFTSLPEIPGMPLNEGNSINDAGHAVGNAYAGGDERRSKGAAVACRLNDCPQRRQATAGKFLSRQRRQVRMAA
ncbi:MAG: hypothetical protein ABSH34_28465 [Verrucomicrobiota bacterium]